MILIAVLFRAFAATGAAGTVLALVASLSVMMGFGLYGSSVAWVHGGYRTVDELKRGERGWTVFGILLIGLELLLLIISVGSTLR